MRKKDDLWMGFLVIAGIPLLLILEYPFVLLIILIANLCLEKVDDRVKPILDTEIFNMGASYQINQHLMYLHLSTLYEDDAGDSN